jgi:3-phenylpropionate/trans-cinnamate dioxygenase ferredoxin subunit
MDDGFVTVARLEDCEEGKPLQVWLGDRPLCLCRVGGEVFAISDTCTHREFSLSKGTVTGYAIQCPEHGARFDLRTGKVLRLPAVRPVRTYPVRVVDGAVQVRA